GRRSGDPVRLQGMALLESAHGFLQLSINGARFFITVRFVEVAGNREPGGEDRYAFVRQAEGERWTALYRWPASRYCEVPVSRERIAQSPVVEPAGYAFLQRGLQGFRVQSAFGDLEDQRLVQFLPVVPGG